MADSESSALAIFHRSRHPWRRACCEPTAPALREHNVPCCNADMAKTNRASQPPCHSPGPGPFVACVAAIPHAHIIRMCTCMPLRLSLIHRDGGPPQPRDPGESLQGTQARRLQTTFTWCRASVPVSGGEAKSLHTGPGLPDGSDAVATDPNLPLPRLPPGALPVGPCCLPCSGPGTVPLPPTPCCLPSPPSPGALPRGPVLPCMLRTVDMTLALKAA